MFGIGSIAFGMDKQHDPTSEWTDSLKNDFQNVKEMINTLPKLYFVNDSDPLTVYTDESDLGIGA